MAYIAGVRTCILVGGVAVHPKHPDLYVLCGKLGQSGLNQEALEGVSFTSLYCN